MKPKSLPTSSPRPVDADPFCSGPETVLRPRISPYPGLPLFTLDLLSGIRPEVWQDFLVLSDPHPVVVCCEHLALLNERPLPGPAFHVVQVREDFVPLRRGSVFGNFNVNLDFRCCASLVQHFVPGVGLSMCLQVSSYRDMSLGDPLFGHLIPIPCEPHLLLSLFCALSEAATRLGARRYAWEARN